MAKILKYQKVTDSYTTHCLCEPDYNLLDIEDRVTELCTLDGWTYVSVPETVALPDQPPIISKTLQEVGLEKDAAVVDAIIAASPAYRSINGRVVDMIRARYSVNDEIKMLRTGPTKESEAYNDYVEECRAWGRAEKERLGLMTQGVK